MTTDTTTKEDRPFAAALPLRFCGCLKRNGCDLNSYGLRGLRNPILHRCRHANNPIDVSHTNFADGFVKKNNKVILKHSSHGTPGDNLKSF
jgi:hypothetical protein